MTDSKFKVGSELIDKDFVTKSQLNSVYSKIDQKYKNPSLFATGLNHLGQLGLGDTTSRSSPVQVGSLTNWKLISSYYTVSLAIKTDGTLWSWGYNNYGQLGSGTIISRSSPVQVGSLANWKQVIGCFNPAAIKTDGTLWAWGYNNSGQLGLGDVIRRSSPVQVGSLTNWKYIDTTNGITISHTLAIKTDGTLWAWGDNFNGNLGLGDNIDRSSPVQVGNLTNWKEVKTGSDTLGSNASTLAIKTDGTLWACGTNTQGQLGLGDTTSRSSPVQVGNLTDWKQIQLKYRSVFAIKTDGTLWAWGFNGWGILGIGDTTSRSSPVQVGSLTNWKDIKLSEESLFAIKTDGTLWAWGYNANGALGLGDVTNRSLPVQVGNSTNWKQIFEGRFLLKDGLEE